MSTGGGMQQIYSKSIFASSVLFLQSSSSLAVYLPVLEGVSDLHCRTAQPTL